MNTRRKLLLLGKKGGFNPLSLFQNGEQGVWYDPSDLSSMNTLFDLSGTQPTIGDPVGYIADKSGNGNHATIATSSFRPTLRQTAGGLYYLDFDGVDDYLESSVIDFSAYTKMSAFLGTRKLSDANRQVLFRYSNTADSVQVRFEQSGTVFGGSSPFATYKSILRRTSDVLPEDFSGFVTPNDYPAPLTSVLSSTYDRSLSGNDAVTRFRIDGAEPATNETDVTGTVASVPTHFDSGKILLGNSIGGGLNFGGRIFGYILRGGDISLADIEKTESFLADKTGVSL